LCQTQGFLTADVRTISNARTTTANNQYFITNLCYTSVINNCGPRDITEIEAYYKKIVSDSDCKTDLIDYSDNATLLISTIKRIIPQKLLNIGLKLLRKFNNKR